MEPMRPDPERWHVEEFDPDLDLPPEGHHAQPQEDPPDVEDDG